MYLQCKIQTSDHEHTISLYSSSYLQKGAIGEEEHAGCWSQTWVQTLVLPFLATISEFPLSSVLLLCFIFLHGIYLYMKLYIYLPNFFCLSPPLKCKFHQDRNSISCSISLCQVNEPTFLAGYCVRCMRRALDISCALQSYISYAPVCAPHLSWELPEGVNCALLADCQKLLKINLVQTLSLILQIPNHASSPQLGCFPNPQLK